jgi:hypothetical protein
MMGLVRAATTNGALESWTYVDQVEQEEHGDSGRGDRSSFRRIRTGAFIETAGDNVYDEKACGAQHHASSTSPTIDDPSGDNGTDNTDRVETTSQTVLLEGRVTGLGEQGR